MNEIPRSYLRLFNCVSDAIAMIDEMNFGCAKDTLIEGQIWAEELYIAESEGEVTDEKQLEIFLRLARERAKAEKELAERETDERINARIREWRMKSADMGELGDLEELEKLKELKKLAKLADG